MIHMMHEAGWRVLKLIMSGDQRRVPQRLYSRGIVSGEDAMARHDRWTLIRNDQHAARCNQWQCASDDS